MHIGVAREITHERNIILLYFCRLFKPFISLSKKIGFASRLASIMWIILLEEFADLVYNIVEIMLRRCKIMSKWSTWFTRTLFVVVDKVFYRQQNPKKMLVCENLVTEKDICYDDSKYPEDCRLDTYFVRTNSTKKLPVFFYVHGGGFVAGDKAFREANSIWVAKMGFFVVCVNHTLSPKAQYPEPVQQLVSAMNWVHDNAEKYNLDLDNITVSGDSSGGYFAGELIAATLSSEMCERLSIAPKIKFNGAVLNCGIFDLEAVFSAKILFDLGNKIILDFAGIPASEIKNYPYLKECAPINYVNEYFPATFVTHATQDFFCGGQAQSLCKKLSEYGVYFEEYGSEKFSDNHCFSLTWKTAAAKENNAKTEAFLKKIAAGEVKAKREPVAKY